MIPNLYKSKIPPRSGNLYESSSKYKMPGEGGRRLDNFQITCGTWGEPPRRGDPFLNAFRKDCGFYNKVIKSL